MDLLNHFPSFYNTFVNLRIVELVFIMVRFIIIIMGFKLIVVQGWINIELGVDIMASYFVKLKFMAIKHMHMEETSLKEFVETKIFEFMIIMFGVLSHNFVAISRIQR